MNFAVLIELSRKSIAFRYYRDDAGNMFLPFNENEVCVPLAICCQGNDIQLGAYAQAEAEKHSLYAWDNVFEAIKQNGTFPYRGQEKNMNELLLVAIKKYLADFFDRILVKTNGTLEANISTLPLVFLFHADIDKSDRLFVEKSFRDGGFVNLAAMDMGCKIVERLLQCKELPAGKKMALAVCSDGANLIVSAVDIARRCELKSIRIMGKGIDPRLKCAVDKLWDSLDIYTYEMNKDNEYGILKDIAAAFLASDDVVFQRPVMFSDGIERECYLDKNQIDGIDLGTDTKIRTDILNFISQLGFQESDVVIVLYGALSGNDYFIKNMKTVGVEVIAYKDPGFQNALRYILDGIIAKQFKIGSRAVTSVSDAFASKPLAPPYSTNAHRTLRAASHMMPQQAQVTLMQLENSLKKISPPPSDLKQYLDLISKTLEEAKANAKQPGNHGRVAVAELSSRVGSHPVSHKVEAPMPTAVTLSAAEVRNINEAIFRARSEAPNEAVKHLKELLAHIESLNPVNMRMWSSRLQKELAMANRRLANMPKPVKTSSAERTVKVKRPVMPSAPPKADKPVKPAQSHQFDKKGFGAFGAIEAIGAIADGFNSVVKKVTESNVEKAQKLFTDTFRETFKTGKDESVKQLENLLEKLHKMGVHKFDFQIKSRIKLLKK